MISVVSANLNGIRSASTKGFFEWMNRTSPDIVCVQELKAQHADMTAEMLAPHGYTGVFTYAEKKGYSGVGVYSKRKPDRTVIGFGSTEFDPEGRYVQCDFGNLSVVSVYCPSGSSGPERHEAKQRFMAEFMKQLRKLVASGRDYIIAGDWNIAHKEIDLKNWKGNLKNSGFLSEERAWLDTLFGEVGLVDTFRELDKRPEQFTWWSARGQAYAKNVGWRIDYQICTEKIASKAVSTEIYKDEKFSDHAPLIISYNHQL